MAAKKITVLGSQAVSNDGQTNILRTLSLKADSTANTNDGGVDEAMWVLRVQPEAGSPNASVEVRLYNSSNALVEKVHSRISSVDTLKIRLRAQSAVEVSASVSTAGTLKWNVAPDAFATGRMEIDIHGKLTSSLVDVIAPSDINGAAAYNEKQTGSGVYTLSVPFTVELL